MRPMLSLAAILLVLAMASLCGLAYGAIPPEPADIDLMVESIRQVENWDGVSRGAAGERGPWQMTEPVWNQYSTLPFSCAEGKSNAEKTEQRRVARECLYAISQRLQAARRNRDALTVAVVYCAGWGCYFYWQPHKPTRAKFAYAYRAENLYWDLWRTARDRESEPGDQPLFKSSSSVSRSKENRP